MDQFAKTYVLVDMGVAHVLTTDRMCIELAFARTLLGTGKLCEFQILEDAYDHVESLRCEGSYWQIFDADKVPWDKPPIDYSEPLYDWPAIRIQAIPVLNWPRKTRKCDARRGAVCGCFVRRVSGSSCNRSTHQPENRRIADSAWMNLLNIVIRLSQSPLRSLPPGTHRPKWNLVI